MKKLKLLKLNLLSKADLEKREMNHLLGGACCACGCGYQGSGGGSSVEANFSANDSRGISDTYAPYGVQACSYTGQCPEVHV